MGLKSFLAKPYARYMRKQIDKWANAPLKYQNQVFERLIRDAKNTAFGKDHNFDKINSYEDFKREVAVSDYEGLRSYVDRMVKGEKNVLWKVSSTTASTLVSQSSMQFVSQEGSRFLCNIFGT